MPSSPCILIVRPARLGDPVSGSATRRPLAMLSLVCTLGHLGAQRDSRSSPSRWSTSHNTSRVCRRRSAHCCSPHELTDHPQAAALAPKGGASIVFERIGFAYPGGAAVFESSLSPSSPVRRSAWWDRRAAASPPCFALAEILRSAGRPRPGRRTGHFAGRPRRASGRPSRSCRKTRRCSTVR